MSFDMARISRRSLEGLPEVLPLVAIIHLDECAFIPRALDQGLVGFQPRARRNAQFPKLVVADVVPFALGEAEQEHREIAEPAGDQRSVAAAAPFARPGHALLDEAAAQVCVDEPAFRPRDRLDKALVGDPLAARELGEESRLVNPDRRIPQRCEL